MDPAGRDDPGSIVRRATGAEKGCYALKLDLYQEADSYCLWRERAQRWRSREISPALPEAGADVDKTGCVLVTLIVDAFAD